MSVAMDISQPVRFESPMRRPIQTETLTSSSPLPEGRRPPRPPTTSRGAPSLTSGWDGYSGSVGLPTGHTPRQVQSGLPGGPGLARGSLTLPSSRAASPLARQQRSASPMVASPRHNSLEELRQPSAEGNRWAALLQQPVAMPSPRPGGGAAIVVTSRGVSPLRQASPRRGTTGNSAAGACGNSGQRADDHRVERGISLQEMSAALEVVNRSASASRHQRATSSGPSAFALAQAALSAQAPQTSRSGYMQQRSVSPGRGSGSGSVSVGAFHKSDSKQQQQKQQQQQHDLLDQHVQYFLRHNRQVAKKHKVSRLHVGVYNIDGQEVRVEWQHMPDPSQGYLVVIDGPLRQPFADYMQMTQENAFYDTNSVAKTSPLHHVPKEKRMTFDDSNKRYDRLAAMKVAKEQALVRERAATFLQEGKEVPGELVDKYNRTMHRRLNNARMTLVEDGGPSSAAPPPGAVPAGGGRAAAAAVAPAAGVPALKENKDPASNIILPQEDQLLSQKEHQLPPPQHQQQAQQQQAQMQKPQQQQQQHSLQRQQPQVQVQKQQLSRHPEAASCCGQQQQQTQLPQPWAYMGPNALLMNGFNSVGHPGLLVQPGMGSACGPQAQRSCSPFAVPSQLPTFVQPHRHGSMPAFAFGAAPGLSSGQPVVAAPSSNVW